MFSTLSILERRTYITPSYNMVKITINGFHKLDTVKFQPNDHLSLRKSVINYSFYYRFIKRSFSVIFEFSHPFGPIGRLNTTAHSPGTGLTILSMPFKGP